MKKHASKHIYSSSRIAVQSSFFKFYFHLKIDYSFKEQDSQSSQRFAREFSLWCGRGIEPSARGRGETKIIDLIERADKRPFTSLWITLRVPTCIYIYIYTGLSDTFGRATGWMGVGRIVNSSPIGWWHARISLENDPPWIETAKRSTSCKLVSRLTITFQEEWTQGRNEIINIFSTIDAHSSRFQFSGSFLFSLSSLFHSIFREIFYIFPWKDNHCVAVLIHWRAYAWDEKEKKERNKWNVKAGNKNLYRVETRLKHLHVSWHVLGQRSFREICDGEISYRI